MQEYDNLSFRWLVLWLVMTSTPAGSLPVIGDTRQRALSSVVPLRRSLISFI